MGSTKYHSQIERQSSRLCWARLNLTCCAAPRQVRCDHGWFHPGQKANPVAVRICHRRWLSIRWSVSSS